MPGSKTLVVARLASGNDPAESRWDFHSAELASAYSDWIKARADAITAKGQLDKIKSYVEIAREEGATVFAGGSPPQLEPQFRNGYFFQPTIFSDVKNSMRVAQEEIFGPVTSVISFDNDDDLIQQANETIYGLSAGVWTRDITRAHRFARAVKAGVVWINTYNMFSAASPFGGYKQSGYGREMGKHALELYTQVKSVWVDLSGKPIGWFGK